MAMVAWLLVAHIFGLTFWVSGLLMTTMSLSRCAHEASTEARQAVARLTRIFLRAMADPGALLTLLAGIALVTTNSTYFLHATWLHIKLGFVLVLIVLHGIVAIRSKLVATGKMDARRSQARLLFVTILIVFLLILVATLPGEVFLNARTAGVFLTVY
jgi:putative membrane protein